MKTKNAPKDLKCKINHTSFFLETGVPKRGGGPTLGKNSQKIPGFFWVASLIAFSTFYSNDVDVAYTASCKQHGIDF